MAISSNIRHISTEVIPYIAPRTELILYRGPLNVNSEVTRFEPLDQGLVDIQQNRPFKENKEAESLHIISEYFREVLDSNKDKGRINFSEGRIVNRALTICKAYKKIDTIYTQWQAFKSFKPFQFPTRFNQEQYPCKIEKFSDENFHQDSIYSSEDIMIDLSPHLKDSLSSSVPNIDTLYLRIIKDQTENSLNNDNDPYIKDTLPPAPKNEKDGSKRRFDPAFFNNQRALSFPMETTFVIPRNALIGEEQNELKDPSLSTERVCLLIAAGTLLGTAVYFNQKDKAGGLASRLVTKIKGHFFHQ